MHISRNYCVNEVSLVKSSKTIFRKENKLYKKFTLAKIFRFWHGRDLKLLL